MLKRLSADRRTRRRGATILLTAVSLVMLCGFCALAIDVGYMLLVRTELQAAADSAALAGASALLDLENMTGGMATDAALEAEARALDFAARCRAAGKPVLIESSDVTVGHIYDPDNLQEAITAGALPYNAVRVRARRAPGSPSGPVDLFFAAIWGIEQTSVGATATAYVDTDVSGFDPPDSYNNGPGPLIPISVKQALWDEWLAAFNGGGGSDLYTVDPVTGDISSGPDGIPEIDIYPEKQKDTGGKGKGKGGGGDDGDDPSDGAGNFGILNFGSSNSSAGVPAEQIRNGLTAGDIAAAIGSEEIVFYTDDGTPITYLIDGTPGIKTGPISSALDVRLGDIIGFFIHVDVDESGTNAIYTVVNAQFGRLVLVQLTGNDKKVLVQPGTYWGDEDIITDPDAPSHETAGKLRLIR
jgi:hypothetical protein